jgi:DNA-binding XRE family transcriptional regulator
MTDEQRIIAASERHPELGLRPIARELGISEWRVRVVRQKHGYDARQVLHRLDRERVAKMVRTNRQRTQVDMALELGVTPDAFRQSLRRARVAGLCL